MKKSQSMISVIRKQRTLRKAGFDETLQCTLKDMEGEVYWNTRRFLLGKPELLQLKALKKKLKVVRINNLEEEPWADLSSMEGSSRTR